MNHQKNGRQGVIKPLDVRFLLNDFKATMEDLKQIVNGGKLSIQDLTQPTHQIKPITDLKPQSNVVLNTLPPKPMASLFDAFVGEIKKAATIPEIEEIMKRVKAEAMLPREKMQLEAMAKEASKEMYND